MAKKTAGARVDPLDLFKKLVASVPTAELKGATVPYTAVNGNMYSYLSKEGRLAVRLPVGAREAFLKKYGASLCTSYGIVQKEYVEVPASLLRKTAELNIHFEASLRYAQSLKGRGAAKKK